MSERSETEKIILEEFRDFRSMILPQIQEMRDSQTTLETSFITLFSDARPGSYQEMQKKVSSLETWRNRLAGGVAVTGFLLGWLLRTHL